MFDNQHRAAGRPAGVQRRGVERVQAILDAAETLLAEQGYDAATLKAIGEHAGIPTASLYHYFPDRHQVDAALVQRHLRELDAKISASVNSAEVRTLREAIDTVVDPYLAYFREHPDFIQLWFVGRSPTLNELALKFDELQAEQFWSHLVDKNLVRPDTPQLVVQLAFEAGNRLFDVAFRRSATGDDATMAEVRRLLTSYLETYAPQAKAPRAK
ncbi:TetR/AcrR family transcriptional regulator [Mycobacterium vicinigordonae]|uniref:TetR family transcriptional regulator n=1 Tax=Mycobacterium vicinigordonae TaxID=1719132 RepID=A0A7D6DYM0_9MYCO|nr:TetR/AcrR family transcriptional regulator [Mycobacterium vicinigordonae]QLL07648.1 TetR family transcriptional regulator [Mycobacterium vicinigordonae]